jgi:sec-independent protein translocase protein TatC
MSLLEHLEELRQRLIRGVIGLLMATGMSFLWAPEICRFFAQPIYRFLPPGTKLVFLSVTDPFLLYFRTALIFGAFLVCPYWLWEIWGFVAPGLYPRERRWAGPFVILGWMFFLAGGAFGYTVAFPAAVEFLLQVPGDDFLPMIAADRYYSFLLTILLGLGLMFELPVLLVLLAKLGIVSSRFLFRHFRHAILVIVLVSAVITPTSDLVNLALFAVPTTALYLLGALGARLVEPRPIEENTTSG